MQLNCLIVDDEPLALDLIERYVKNTPFLVCVGRCNSAIEAMAIMQNVKIDLLFMDIQMPELSGLEFSKQLSLDTRVIFTTAFDRYAIEGYKVNALDYLLKPFNFSEFYQAAQKALEWYDAKEKRKSQLNKEFIFVKSEYKQVKIDLNDVIYFEGLKDYIKIWLRSQSKPVYTLMSLKSLENDLNPDFFMRVHRSFLIALNQIQTVERSRVCMSNQVYISISDQYKAKFQGFIQGKSIL